MPSSPVIGGCPALEAMRQIAYETVLRADAHLRELGCERTDDTIIAVLTYLP